MATSTSAAGRGRRGWADLPVAVKLSTALVALVAVVLGTTLLAVMRLEDAGRRMGSLSSDNLSKTVDIASVQTYLLLSSGDVLNEHIATDDRVVAGIRRQMQVDQAGFEASLTAYAQGAHAATPEQLAQLRGAWQQFLTVRDQALLPLSRSGNAAGFYAAYIGKAVPAIAAGMQLVQDIATAEHRAADAQVAAGRAAASTARTWMIVISLLGLAVAVALAVLAVRSVVRPVREVSGALGALAAGDLTTRVAARGRDEIGVMAQDLNRAVGALRDLVSEVATRAQALSRTSGTVDEVSEALQRGAGATLAKARVASEATTEVTSTVSTAAAGAEQMSASIREIATSASDAVRVGGEALASARATNEQVGRLGQSAEQIGDVLALISSIAEQTNLLALNATIESARAGDAGRGFAVVATEVKALAQQTAAGAQDIGQRVSAIQAETGEAVSSIATIGGVMETVQDHQSTIASAVEEQTSVTTDIARNVSLAAESAATIARTVTEMTDEAERTASTAGTAREAARELGGLADDLGGLVARFRL